MTKVNRPSSAPCKMDGVWTKNMFLLYSYHARWMVYGQETCSCSIPILLLNTMVSNNIVTIVGILLFKNLLVLVLYIFLKIQKTPNFGPRNYIFYNRPSSSILSLIFHISRFLVLTTYT